MITEVRAPASERRRAPIQLVQPLADPVDASGAPEMLTACSVCLRVWDGSDWIEAEHTILRLRSFECSTPPRFRPAICRPCVAALRARHGRPALPPSLDEKRPAESQRWARAATTARGDSPGGSSPGRRWRPPHVLPAAIETQPRPSGAA